MIDAKKRAELDQSLALMLEFYPIQWRQMYLRLVEEGFNETQALELVKTYIKASLLN
jgi:hypothetical protein